jgi:hypothetical protein
MAGQPRCRTFGKEGRVKAEEINKEINTPNLIWSFFEAHPLP